MHLFSPLQWVLLFYVCCFFGWCLESVVVSCQQHKFVNRGFLHGPMIPLYGFGALMILAVAVPLQQVFDNPFVIYVCGIVACTVLEYITAVVMERLFNTRYWEYDDEKGNFKGRICIKASLFWGGLTLLVVYVLQPMLTALVNLVPTEWLLSVDIVITALFVCDLIWSFYSAFDFSRLLERAEKLRCELESLAARAGDSEAAERFERLKSHFAEIKEETYRRMDRFAAKMYAIIRFDEGGSPHRGILPRRKEKKEEHTSLEKTEDVTVDTPNKRAR